MFVVGLSESVSVCCVYVVCIISRVSFVLGALVRVCVDLRGRCVRARLCGKMYDHPFRSRFSTQLLWLCNRRERNGTQNTASHSRTEKRPTDAKLACAARARARS